MAARYKARMDKWIDEPHKLFKGLPVLFFIYLGVDDADHERRIQMKNAIPSAARSY